MVIFMAISSFDKVYTKRLGDSNEIACPVCSSNVSFALFENLDISPVASILGKAGETYFAVCPKCASIFNVNEEYIKAKTSGMTCFITPSDLSVSVKNNG